jgi:hypothetical protein
MSRASVGGRIIDDSPLARLSANLTATTATATEYSSGILATVAR